ncbi:hypothetical protein LTR97_008345 [Elasticomyces elasticus]|uniref:DNA-directed RNA polymerase subunit n=1 Tax=Elasticomyces elasticus TaxID=574655 RepID=A0AAN7WCH2_9PEZI|nr:hypothetical protein LTR97_008345 [Elasticomyces elasticus]
MAPTFSSVPAPETPATKAKAGAESIAKSAKKRKREEEQNDVQETTEPSSKKKSKKAKVETGVAVTPVTQQNGPPASSEIEVVKSVKKERKDKKKRKASEDPIVDGLPVEEPSKQVKKERRSESLEGVDPAIPAAAITPKHDVIEGTEQKAKKSKKDKKLDKERRSVSQEVSGDAGSGAAAVPVSAKKKKPKAEHSTPAAAPAVIAGSSRAQQSSHVKSQASREVSKPLTDEQRLETQSPFLQKTETFYLALSPCANDFPLEGLVAEHISPLLLTYHPPLGGVVLKYSNARLSETPDGNADDNNIVLSKAMDEYAVTFVYLTLDLVLFKPSKGTWLEGYVNLQNESLLGLVCYNYFNAAIERQRLPQDWRWQEDASQSSVRSTKQGNGCWVDGSGEKVDGKVAFRVKDFEATAGGEGGAGSMNILGTLLSGRQDSKIDEAESQRSEKGGRTK